MQTTSDYKQDPPNCVKFEMTEGCDAACSMCGIQQIRDNGADGTIGRNGKNSGPFKYAGIELAERVAEEMERLGWNSRVEFAMRGEPTLNPDAADIIAAFRDALPNAYLLLTSNGGGLLKGNRVAALFGAGLNTLALDMYTHLGRSKRLREIVAREVMTSNQEIDVYDYPAQVAGNPHPRHHGKKIVFVEDIRMASKGTHSHVSNHAGSSGYRDASWNKRRCAKPFRELPIRFDGNVPLCCVTWTGHYKIANVFDLPLDEIWQHPRFNAARHILMSDGRNMEPCNGCTDRSNRVGILPDRMGKVKLPPATAEHYALAQEAVEGEHFTLPVRPRYPFKE